MNEIIDELFYNKSGKKVGNNKINIDINKSNIKFADNQDYKDYVLNSLLYDEAKKLDNRTFFQYYFSLNKEFIIISFLS